MDNEKPFEKEGGIDHSAEAKFANIDPRESWEMILSRNQDVIQADEDKVFATLLAAIEAGWQKLTRDQQKEIMHDFEALIGALRNYHDSYTNLKSAADMRRSFLQETEKYQEAIQRADRQERILHNAFLDSLNILSRRMKEFGLDNSWRGMNAVYESEATAMREKVKSWMFRIFKEK